MNQMFYFLKFQEKFILIFTFSIFFLNYFHFLGVFEEIIIAKDWED